MEKTIKIRFLKNCMQWNEGMEVDMPEDQAKQICQLRIKQIGEGKTEKYHVALPVEEIERLKSLPIDQGGLTLDEARALGLKNIVSPPEGYDDPYAPVFKDEPATKSNNEAYFNDGRKGKKK